MRLRMKHCHGGVWYSQNGHRAYLAGERPGILLADKTGWEPTLPHHIQRLRNTIVRENFTHELVLFWREVKQ